MFEGSMQKRKVALFTLLSVCLFLIVLVPYFPPTPLQPPTVKVQEPQQNVFGNPSLPSWKNITVTAAGDGKSLTLDNANNLTWTFPYGAKKYDGIYQGGIQIVKDELWMLQYYDGSWKDVGSSVNLFYEQVAPYNVRVTQAYTSANGNYNITWDFYGGARPKITLVANITVAGSYKFDWRTYVYKDYCQNMTNYVKFWNAGEEAVVFDYSDVYEAFGNITSVEGVEDWVKGKRFDLIFNVGFLSVGEFRLDPTIGYEIKGATAVTIDNYIRGSKFWVFGEGMLGNITVYLYVRTYGRNIKCAIYNSAFNLLGSTALTYAAAGTGAWITCSFASPVWLLANNYYWLCVWGGAKAAAASAYYDAGDAKQGLSASATFGDYPTTLTGYTLAATKLSIYGTYQSYSIPASLGYKTAGTQVYYPLGFRDTIIGSVFTMTEAGIGRSITAYIERWADNVGDKCKFAIYKHSDLSLVAVTQEYSAPDTNDVVFWCTLNFVSPPALTANTEYVLVAWGQTTFYGSLYYDAGDVNQGHYQSKAYTGTFPNSLIPTHNNNKYSIYCTYTSLYEYYNTGDNDYWVAYDQYWQAQTFTVGATGHTVNLVKLKLYRYGSSPGTVTVSIRATDGTHPTGADLTSGTIDGDSLTDVLPGLWYEIALTGYTLSANTKYAIVVRAPNGDESNYVSWRAYSYSPTYDGGNWERSIDSGGTWITETYSDLMFEVWGNPLPNTAPTNGAGSITDMDDTNNIYTQKKLYTGSSVATDTDGYADIHYMEFRLKQGATVRASFQYHEDDNTFNIQAGSTAWDLDASSSASRSGNTITVTWKFSPQWDAVEESALSIELYVIDAASAADTDTAQSNYVDVVTRLVTSNFATDDGRINVGGTTTISGTVYYANNPASTTSSSSYPPDAEFTSVSIHNSAHSVQATDTTIFNGAFSVSFAIPSAVQSNTYHVYINLADADGPDQDAVDGDTIVVIGDRIKITVGGIVDNTVDVDLGGKVWYHAVYEYEPGTPFTGSCGMLYLNGVAMTWATDRWIYAFPYQMSGSQTVFHVTSVAESTYGLTGLNNAAGDIVLNWATMEITINKP